ncbi:drug resistance abc transporter [Anaeramoeba flamelloides]|uniref:Drug resistance abc transporter n=1 Tax=Anaeramoeba flamelloides TaxID=1746091 RepID=A0ABQ8Y5N2_9EUKA|nr:drug resistance abc transporter [Anaeramoeba flamelloides]
MLKIDPNRKKINKEIILVFFQTYTHYIEENELTSDRIWCMDETPCQHSDTPKKSFKLRNSKSFSKTHGFNQRDTLVACIRADGARLAPMIIETRNAYLNKKRFIKIA